MSQRLILHIGRHKTGTTAIQQYCQGAGAQFEREGIIYPLAGRIDGDGRQTPGHHHLANQCHFRFHDDERFAAIKRDFEAEIAGYDTVIISSEGFQNLPGDKILRKFFDDFGGFDLTIVCYLREYLSYLVSSYRQMIQNQERFMTFGDYCRHDFGIEKFLKRWSEIGRLVTRPFERARLKNEDIVADFLDLADLEKAEDEQRILNHSIGGNLLYFRLAESRFGLERTSYLEAERLASRHAHFRRGFHIPDEIADRVRNGAAYNDVITEYVGPLALESYADEPVVPTMATLEEDIARVYPPERQQWVRDRLLKSAEEARAWFEL